MKSLPEVGEIQDKKTAHQYSHQSGSFVAEKSMWTRNFQRPIKLVD